ncbi:unnamed protein product [Acanthoscelides obtectus]|uniref:Transposase n=1 Tax=Acanthoscelides obtectus TaxID=200917 RepID=A0A9P0PTF6_ACAOB|nr:unnamed protein product [Acanthoscelides obtectus]CAK1657190.1 hypothetical protein AOBTE_LOCUS20190 [Acanthoscelides obtectus]
MFGSDGVHYPDCLSDDPRVGAPKTAVTQENVDAVCKLIIEDRHVTYRKIEAPLKISKTSIQKILHEELGVRKLVSRWIPARVNFCQKTLDREEKPTKMVATFVSKAGPIATIPLEEQRTVTADWYTTMCLSKVITELRKINPERRIILHQDNASSRTAQKTRHPNLSPNDFFTFPKIKNRLQAVDAFKNAVLDLPANKWNKCFENWFERMQMCINIRGEYFEKQ